MTAFQSQELPAASMKGSALTRSGVTAASVLKALQESAARGISTSASPILATLEGAWTVSS